MTKNIRKSISSLLLSSALLAAGGIGLFFGESKTLSVNAEEGIMPLSCTSVDTPSVDWNAASDFAHSCVSTYGIIQEDTHASRIYYKATENTQYYAGSIALNPGESTNYVVTSTSTDRTCTPKYYALRAYCTVDKIYSDYNTELRDSTKYTYAQYPTTAKTPSAGTIPTSWNTTNYTWEHGGSTGDVIQFSFAYNGKVADGHVTIPLLGYASYSTSELDDEIVFEVRTGPQKLSIRASSSVACDDFSTLFAYYLQS